MISPGTTGRHPCRYCSGDHDPEWHMTTESRLRSVVEAQRQEIKRLERLVRTQAAILDQWQADRAALAPAAGPE